MRLIDADALLLNSEVYYDRAECLVLRYAIEKAPIVNAVPVVRCKDCKHYIDAHADGSMYCMRPIRAEDYYETGYIYPLEVPVTDHCFCSYGERREEE